MGENKQKRLAYLALITVTSVHLGSDTLSWSLVAGALLGLVPSSSPASEIGKTKVLKETGEKTPVLKF